MLQTEVVMGMVLKVEPIGEYDRRLVILTKEKGKISAFAKGARRPGNRFMAATNPFCFGKFHLYQGRMSYTVQEIQIDHYFESLRTEFEKAYYGMYFMEVADYYTRENNDEVMMLKLLFQSMKALVHPSYDEKLVKAIFEIKAIVVNGEFPGLFQDIAAESLCAYTIHYIVQSEIEKLFSFSLKDEVLQEVIFYASKYQRLCIPKRFKTLEVIESLY